MRKEIIDLLKENNDEETAILKKSSAIERARYTTGEDFIINSESFLEKGTLIDIRKHPRYAAFPEHRHNYIEMLYVVSGSLTTVVDRGESLTLSAGDLLLLNQSAVHEIFPCKKNDLAVNFLILPEFFSRSSFLTGSDNFLREFLINTVSNQSSPYNFLLFHTADTLPLENLLENLLWNLLIKKRGINLLTQSTMDLLFMNLTLFSTDILHREEDPRRDLLLHCMNYVNQNYQSGSLEDLSKETGYTPYYLSRLLKHYTGKNFTQILQQRRLEQAVFYLENTTLPTDKILPKIGYENSSYFYRIFREKYQCSPREYRREHSFLS